MDQDRKALQRVKNITGTHLHSSSDNGELSVCIDPKGIKTTPSPATVGSPSCHLVKDTEASTAVPPDYRAASFLILNTQDITLRLWFTFFNSFFKQSHGHTHTESVVAVNCNCITVMIPSGRTGPWRLSYSYCSYNERDEGQCAVYSNVKFPVFTTIPMQLRNLTLVNLDCWSLI